MRNPDQFLRWRTVFWAVPFFSIPLTFVTVAMPSAAGAMVVHLVFHLAVAAAAAYGM